MASFSLRSQRTGQYKEFTLLEILKLLGDRVNDEIWLENGEDVFNLSSFIELKGGETGGSGGTTGNWTMEVPAIVNGQMTFYLGYLPSGILMVVLNGLVLSADNGFTRNGREINLPFVLNAQDRLQFIYQH